MERLKFGDKMPSIIDVYIDECRRVNGDEYADLIKLCKRRGWYMLTVPWNFQGRWKKGGNPRDYRLYEIEEMIERLRQRPDFDAGGD